MTKADKHLGRVKLKHAPEPDPARKPPSKTNHHHQWAVQVCLPLSTFSCLRGWRMVGQFKREHEAEKQAERMVHQFENYLSPRIIRIVNLDTGEIREVQGKGTKP